MENCNNVSCNELMLKMLDKFEKLTNQVEEMRIHLGLQPPKTIPVDYGTPDKPTAVFIDDIPEIVESNASFTLKGPDINVVRQVEKELIGDRDAVYLFSFVYKDKITGTDLKTQTTTHLPFVRKRLDEEISAILSAFSNPERCKITRVLLEAGMKGMNTTDLMEATELSTGQFYHHLKELTYQQLVVQEDKKYLLSKLGFYASIALPFIACLILEGQSSASEK